MYLQASIILGAFFLFAAFIGFHDMAPYLILRWAGFLYCAYTAWLVRKKSPAGFWLFVLMAVIINPIIKLRFSRDTWETIDMVYGVVIFSAARIRSRIRFHNGE